MTEKTKRSLLLALITLSAVPSFTLVAPPSTLTVSSALLYLSAVTGYLGVVLLLWMYILGARSVFGTLFTDIAPVMRIHKWLGKYGSVLVVLHPLFVLCSYGESLLYPFVLHLSTAFERHVTLGRLSFYLLLLVWCTSVLVRGKLGYRGWKYIHYLAYISLPFALLHIPGTGSQFSAHLVVRVYFFALVGLFLVFSLLRLREIINASTYSATVIDQHKVAENSYALQLAIPPTTPLPKPGQYVYLKCGVISEAHPFSVLQSTQTSLWLAYRSVGRYTKFLRLLQPKTRVEVSRPYGTFLAPLSQSSQSPVFIAGGIGITPFMQTLENISSERAWLFYANRSHASTLFAEALREKLGTRYVPIFSEEPALLPHETAGFITSKILLTHLKEPDSYIYFICGPPQMTNHVLRVLAELGVPPAQIHTEAFEF